MVMQLHYLVNYAYQSHWRAAKLATPNHF